MSPSCITYNIGCLDILVKYPQLDVQLDLLYLPDFSQSVVVALCAGFRDRCLAFVHVESYM